MCVTVGVCDCRPGDGSPSGVNSCGSQDCGPAVEKTHRGRQPLYWTYPPYAHQICFMSETLAVF